MHAHLRQRGRRVVFGAEGKGPLPAFIINPSSISNNEYLCQVRDYTVRQADVTFTGAAISAAAPSGRNSPCASSTDASRSRSTATSCR
jgi:hypothetical protein